MEAIKKTISIQIKPQQLASRFSYHLPVIVLGVLAALVILWGLAESSLVDWDEAIYAQISKEMIQRGNWLTLHFGNKLWFEKPPLFMWSTAILYKFFGINEFTARAMSAFSGVVLVIITYLVGKSVYDKWVGFLAGIILLTSYRFIDSARVGTTDVMLTLFIYLAFYGYLRLGQSNNQKWWYLIWISGALGFMTKSAAVLVAPIVVVLLLLLDKRLIATFKAKHFWMGLLLASVIVIPWHIIMYLQHGLNFVDSYLGKHILERSASGLETHIGDGYFYVWTLQYQFFPWFYMIPFALALNLQKNLEKRSPIGLLLLTVIVVFGAYTVIQTKLHWYIVPLFPALVILIASTMVEAFRSNKSVAFSGLILSVIVVALTAPLNTVLIFGDVSLLVIVLFWAIKKLSNLNRLNKSSWVGLRIDLANLKNIPTAFVTRSVSGIMCLFLVVVGINEILPLYHAEESSVAKLARIAGSSNPDREEPVIIFSGLWPQTTLFYSNRPVVQTAYSYERLVNFIRPSETEIILAKKDLEPLSSEYEISVKAEVDPLVYATIKPKNGPAPYISQEIRYKAPEMGEVFFIWGINGWNVLPEASRPAETTITEGNAMQTPMKQEGDTFVVEIKAPEEAIIDYGFLITKNHSGNMIEAIWDGGETYQVVASNGETITVETPSTVAQQITADQPVETSRSTSTTGDSANDQSPVVTQEIRYKLPEAGEVFLVWGIDGWQTVPEKMRPAGTVGHENGLMTTPMIREGDTFVLDVQVPAGVAVDYVFQITRTRSGVGIEVWDANGAPKQDYHTIATSEGVVEIQAAASVKKYIIIRDITVVDFNLELLLFLIGVCLVFAAIVVSIWFVRPAWFSYVWHLRYKFTNSDVLKVAVVIITITIVGLSIVGNYGLSWDEPFGFWRSWNNLDLIIEGKIASGDWKYYGVLLDGTAEFIFQAQAYFRRNILHQVQDFYPTQYLNYLGRMMVKHKVTFLFSLIAYISIAGITGLLCSRKYAWLGPIVLALFPRFFGASFFNFKDIPFATLFILCSYVGAYVIGQYINLGYKIRVGANRVTLISILYGVLVGLLSSIRIGGIVVVFFVVLAYMIVRLGKENVFKNFFVNITQGRFNHSIQNWKHYLLNRSMILEILNIGVVFGLMSVAWLATVFLLHPMSWSYPFGWLFEAVSYLSKHEWPFTVLFNGQFISAHALSWYYLPTWLVMTIPGIFQIAFVIGLIFLFNKYSKFSATQRAAIILVLLQIFFLPLFAIVRHSTIYDGMRQFLFILPGIAVISTIALIWLYEQLSRKSSQRIYVIFAVLIFALIGYDMIKLHPYEYVYFNRMFGGLAHAHNRYETDYWGLSLREGMEWINKNGQSTTVVVGGLLGAARIFAEPRFTVVSLDDALGKTDTKSEADLQQTLNISESFYYLAVPKHGLQKAFPECDTVYQVIRQGVPLSVIKYCKVQPPIAQANVIQKTKATGDGIVEVQTGASLAQDQELIDFVDKSLVTQEIRYQMSAAHDVFLIWGIDGWNTVPKEFRPVGTKIMGDIMYTPMLFGGDTFKTKIQVPSGATIDYTFRIIEPDNNTELWDTNEGEDYHTIASQSEVIEISSNLILSTGQPLATASTINFPLAISLSLVIAGLATVLVFRYKTNSAAAHWQSFFERYRLTYLYDLLRELVSRDLKLRYKRSVLGIVWSLINPLALLLVLYFIFDLVLPLDVPNYPSFLFTGLLVWTWFQSALFSATTAIVDSPDLIKRPGFPVAILPIVTVITHLIHFLLALPILFAFLVISEISLSTALALLPVIMILQFLLTLGISYFLAAIHVSFRDTQYLLGIILLLGFYLSPIFYQSSLIPEAYQWLYHLNPMVSLLEAYRAVLIEGALPAATPLITILAASIATLWVGYRFFIQASYRFVEEL